MNNMYTEISDFLDEMVEAFSKFLSLKIIKSDFNTFKELVEKLSEIFEFKMNNYLNKNSLDYFLNKKYEHVIELEKEVKCKYEISFCNII